VFHSLRDQQIFRHLNFFKMPYRVEISPNARAGCKNTECKNEGIKIQKGELRFGTLVTIQERTSWAYKHW